MKNTFIQIGVITLIFCFIIGISEACVQIADNGDTYTVDNSGCIDE